MTLFRVETANSRVRLFLISDLHLRCRRRATEPIRSDGAASRNVVGKVRGRKVVEREVVGADRVLLPSASKPDLQESDFRFQISDSRFRMSDSRFQIPDFRFQISDFRFQAPEVSDDLKYLKP